MKHTDRVSAIFWFVFSLFIVKESYRFGLETLHSTKAGFLPFSAGSVLGILSLILLISTMGKEQKEMGFELNRKRLPKLAYVLGSLFIYVFLLNTLGFILCTLIFIVFLLLAVEPQRLFVVITAAISVPLFTYLFFVLWLKLQLPAGVFGF